MRKKANQQGTEARMQQEQIASAIKGPTKWRKRDMVRVKRTKSKKEADVSNLTADA